MCEKLFPGGSLSLLFLIIGEGIDNKIWTFEGSILDYFRTNKLKNKSFYDRDHDTYFYPCYMLRFKIIKIFWRTFSEYDSIFKKCNERGACARSGSKTKLVLRQLGSWISFLYVISFIRTSKIPPRLGYSWFWSKFSKIRTLHLPQRHT